VKDIKNEGNIPDCLKWLNDIVKETPEILHNMDYINKVTI
jgi:hypothetical protein